MNREVFITCPITGSGNTQDRSPHVPRTPKDIAANAIEAAKAGAAIVHCHVRDPETGAHSRRVELYREVTERIRESDTDVVINRALVYVALTAALVATYFGSVVLLQTVFRAVTGQENAFAVVISTLAIAALFMPLRRNIQNVIDRRLYRRKYDATQTLAAFSSRMRDEVDMDRLTGELVEVVMETMQPVHASLWLRSADNFARRRPS